MNEPLLITGAAGFIGRGLWARAAATDRPVRRALRRRGETGDVAVGDIGPDTDWSAALAGIEVVVHLAARVHVMREAAADPLAVFRAVNTRGTLNLALQAAAAGVRRFVYLSSIKVNGEESTPGQPFKEINRPWPQDAYAVSKWEAEQGLWDIAAATGLEVVIIRPPLVYGPGVKANFLAMLRWLARGLPLPLGAVNNRRSLVALDNLVDLIFTCLALPAAADQTFLATDGEDLSTPELLRRTAAALGTSARLFPVPPSILQAGLRIAGKGELARRLCGTLQADITKARTVLGWRPPVSVDDGLRAVARYFLESSPG